MISFSEFIDLYFRWLVCNLQKEPQALWLIGLIGYSVY